jgi:MFS family permease
MTSHVTLRPLRSADFRWYLLGRTVDLLGNSMAPVAVAFAVLHIGGGASDLGFVLAARSVPLVLLLLYGGVIADRFPRQTVLVVTCSLAGLAQGVAGYLLISGQASVTNLAAVEAVQGALTAFTMPALQGVVPQIVARSELQRANSLASIARGGAFMIGPALAGILVATSGAGWAVLANAATFALAAVFFARLRLISPSPRGASTMRELREGWSEFVARTWVWVIVVGFGITNAVLACGWLTLGPVIAEETIGPDGWGFVLAAQAVGLFVGTAVMLHVRPRYPLRLGMLGALGFSVALLTLSIRPELALLTVGAFVAGIGFDVFGITWETALQQHIPTDRLSRVASYDMLGSFVAIPVGQIAAGGLSGVFGVREVVLGCAVVHALVTLAVLVTPSVWRVESESSVLAGSGTRT